MFEPQEQEGETSLPNEHESDGQCNTEPVDNAEIEKKSLIILNREVSMELERLHLENMQRVAKCASVKRQRDDIVKANLSAAKLHEELTRTLNQKQEEINTIVNKYGDSCRERANRFRESHRYYNEQEVNKETEEVRNVFQGLKDKENKLQRNVEELRAYCEAIQPDVPENFHLNVENLHEKIKSLDKTLDKLKEELQALQKHT